MIKIFNQNGNEPSVLHFQGKSRCQFQNIMNEFSEREISFPKDVGIITFCNKINIPFSPLIKQLRKNKIAYENPAVDVSVWNHAMKLELLLEAIDKIKSNNVLVLDGLDVVITGGVKELLKKFRAYNKKVLFGATKNNYPNEIIDVVLERDYLGEFRFLNAGTCVGERDAVKRFYEMAVAVSKNVQNPEGKEQFIVRIAFSDMQDEVGFDYGCECFQTFSKAKLSLFNDLYTWQVK